ncbi:putative mitochondrial protein [Trifolium repens]|nr:putative mitochondrial protein [Trifolium repens]
MDPPSPPPQQPPLSAGSGAAGSSVPVTSSLLTDSRSTLKFSLTISEKLGEKNFHLWRQQVEPYINAHNLIDFVVCTRVPPQFVDDESRRSGIVNPEYTIWRNRDQLLLSWLQSTLTGEILSRMIGCVHAYELWDRLFKYFHKQTRARARHLRVELRAHALDGSSIKEYLLRIRKTVDELTSIGDAIPASHHIDVILEGLPSDYAPVVSVIESRFDLLDLDEVEVLLLAHELRLNKFKKQTVTDMASLNLTHATPPPPSPVLEEGSSSNTKADPPPVSEDSDYNALRGGRRGGRGGRNSDLQCQVCSKTGHSALGCWHRFDPQYQVPNGAQHGFNPAPRPPYNPYGHSTAFGYGAPSIAGASFGYPPLQNVWMRPVATPRPSPVPATVPSAFVINASPSASGSWFPDSGASYHVTSDPRNLQQSTPFEGHDQIYIGNGQGLTISSAGTSSFPSPLLPNHPLVLNNLLLVPSITKNLISVSQFSRDNNVYFVFSADSCLVKSQANDAILLKGRVGRDGLYEFPDLALNSAKSSSSLHSSVSINTVSHCTPPISLAPSSHYLWHLRLGHPNNHVFKLVLQSCNFSISNKDTMPFCTACCVGKSHRLHSPASTTTYHKPLELVYSDLWGPSPSPSTLGYSYYISFVDAFSRFTWIYLLKSKSDALTVFKQFKTMVELQLGHPLKVLQTDWGGEFRPFTAYLKELGVVHRLICPHTHHQNGVVERKHRHIVDLGLTLLSQASLPLTFWDYAFLTSVYLINRLPSASLQFQVPYFVLFKIQPDYKFLKVFGCACFPLLRPYNNHKLDFRSQECLFLGYSPSHKGYRCLSSSGRLYISKDVLFNESRFPYNDLFSLSTGSSSKPTDSAVTLSMLPLPEHVPPISLPAGTGTMPDPTTSVQSPSPLSATPVPSTPHSVTNQPLSPLPSTAGSLLCPLVHDSVPTPSSLHTPPACTIPPKAIPLSVPLTNAHSMTTRAKTGFVQPRLEPRLLLTHSEPRNVKQALLDPKWKSAMQAEFDALQANQTWSLVPLPPNRQAIGCKWVFRVKENPDGSVSRYKARLVAKGFHQRQGFDFTETFSPVVKPVTIRIILTIAVTHKWSIQQLDVNNAFLNGILEEEVYMSQPPGFDTTDSTLVCKLHKALYGLKQAPRQWFERLQGALLQLGFLSSKCDPSLFTYSSKGNTIYLLVYVDDIIITSNNSSLLQSFIEKLNQAFSLKHLGSLDYFLGIEVNKLPNGSLLLSQSKYIRDLLNKTNMLDSAPVSTPMQSTCKLHKDGSPALSDPFMYRSVVGALQYATLTRPEISFAVNKVCQFMSHPLEAHWVAVKRILRYLKGTLHHGLCLSSALASSAPSLKVFCDADWASDPDDRRSTSGAALYFGPNLVSWWSRKQPVVARSSTEAEYRSLAHATAELLWVQTLLTELHVSFTSPVIYCDNLSAVSLAHNPVMHSRTKHMEIDLFFVREKVISKQLSVLHIPGTDQWADCLTKPLSSSKFLELISKLNVTSARPP